MACLHMEIRPAKSGNVARDDLTMLALPKVRWSVSGCLLNEGMSRKTSQVDMLFGDSLLAYGLIDYFGDDARIRRRCCGTTPRGRRWHKPGETISEA